MTDSSLAQVSDLLCLNNSATPGPGSYTLPSEFGRLILPGKRGIIDDNSQGQSRLGTMTDLNSRRYSRFNASEMQNRRRKSPGEEELRFMSNKAAQMSVPTSKVHQVRRNSQESQNSPYTTKQATAMPSETPNEF